MYNIIKTNKNNLSTSIFFTAFLAGLCSLFVCMILPLASQATDWYVRPQTEAGVYGEENGQDYANAWNGLININWDNIKPGDTIWVCGLHIQNKTADLISYFTTNGKITIPSGTDEEHRITLRGDHQEDPGIIWRAYRMSYEDWVQPDINNFPNVWSITLKGVDHNRDYFFQDIGHPNNNDFTVLNSLIDAHDYDPGADLASQLASLNSKPGYTYSANITSGDKYGKDAAFYVHCTDSGNPTGRIYAPLWGYYLYIEGGSYITIKEIALHNDALCIKNPTPVSSYIRIENCIWDYGAGKMPYIAEEFHHIEIIGCEIAWGANGPYSVTNTFIDGKSNGAYNLLFSKNYVHDIGVRPFNQNGDAHAFAVQGGHDIIIEDNIIINVGHAIILYANTAEDLYNVDIRRNFARDFHPLGAQNPSIRMAIGASCSSRGIAKRSGIKIYQNIVKNAPKAFRCQFEDDLLLYNNIAMDCEVGLESTRSNPVLDFVNGNDNISQWATLTDNPDYLEADNVSVIIAWEEEGVAPNKSGQICMRDGTATLRFINGKHNFNIDEEFKIAENPRWYGGIFNVPSQSGSSPDIEGVFFYIGSISINPDDVIGFHICAKNETDPMNPDNWWAEVYGPSVPHTKNFPDGCALYINGEYFGNASGTSYREGTDIYSKNNIFYNCSKYFINWPAWVDAPDYHCEFNKNIYYPESGAMFYRRTKSYTFSEWQALDSKFDPESLTVDPLFSNNSGTYGSLTPDFPYLENPEEFRRILVSDFTLTSSSPALNAGEEVGLINDFLGNPIVDAPDIGPLEYDPYAENKSPIAIISAYWTSNLVPMTVEFDGSASYDPDGDIISYSWNFGTGDTASGPTATYIFTEAGKYTVTLTVTDNNNATGSECFAIEALVNKAPVVDAGEDQTITLPEDRVNLQGSVTDDGLPPDLTLTVNWEKISGRGPVKFDNPNSECTTASFRKNGVYVLQLTANDGLLSTSDTVTITVNE